jgi:C-terminal peptidase prc
LAPLDSDLRLQVFDQVWTLVRDRYVYQDYRGLDWNAIRDEFAPRVGAAASAEEFYTLMRELIDRLGDDHSGFQTPQDVAQQEEEFRGTLQYAGIGAMVRESDDGGVITRLANGGPAQQAGLQPRELILAVNGIPYSDTERLGSGGLIGRVRGAPGTQVMLLVRGRDGITRDVTIVRNVIPSDAFPSVEGQRLPGSNVGFVLIDTFYLENLDQLVADKIDELLATGPLDALIIDVRDNGGGRVDLMLKTIGLFVDGNTVGKGIGRRSSYDLNVPGGTTIPMLQDVPIAVLVSEETVSAGEIFSAGMQLLGRAKIVGVPSAGNTENLSGHTLDDGSQLWLAEWAYTLPDGTLIEGRGVQPDRVVEAEWWRFEPQNDPQVIAARELLGR